MKTSYNGATSMPAPLERDIDAASRAGFDGIELWWDKVEKYLVSHSLADLRHLLQSRNLQPVAICPLTIWPFRDTEPARKAFVKAVETAPELGCDLLIACPDFQPARLTPEQALTIHAGELASMAEKAERHGVRLAIEPIGRHTLVPGPVQALDLIRRAGSPGNVGVLVDTFHYFRSQVTQEELRAIPPDRLFLIHVNDTEDGAIDELNDGHRLYPTLGVIPLKAMLSTLVECGYQGFFSVEIFRREYWDQPVDEVAARSHEHLMQLLQAL